MAQYTTLFTVILLTKDGKINNNFKFRSTFTCMYTWFIFVAVNIYYATFIFQCFATLCVTINSILNNS